MMAQMKENLEDGHERATVNVQRCINRDEDRDEDGGREYEAVVGRRA
jgi:hypothetical protein